ncbi:hypothetical protein GCM10023189_38760 [Nibrella saemangeumensis]|uniref:histidine kinase n=1 Tax=Nibrella saemangeumensis TaxID=1084526 RepID=A0ABP8N9J7_9BACT
MRTAYLLAWLLLLEMTAFGQTSVTTGQWLRTGWKFHPGDNLAWADPAFDDHQWESLNPADYLQEWQQDRVAGSGWFRLRFRVAPALAGQPVTLLLSQIGASELYLNGRPIHRVGVVSAQPADEQTRYISHQPIHVTVLDTGVQVLAVRYSLTKSNFYFNLPIPVGWGDNPAYALQLEPATASVTNYARWEAVGAVPVAFTIGFFLVLAILHLFIYISFRKGKANLYFGLALVQLSIWRLIPPLLIWAELPVSLHYSLLWAGYGFGALAGTFIVLASYQVFRRKLDWGFITLAAFWLVVWATLPWNPQSITVSIAGTFLVMLLAAWVAFLSIRPGNRIGWLYLIGSGLWVLINLLMFQINPETNVSGMAVGQAAMDIIIPFVISIVLGNGYVRANRTLEAKLVEVEQLSQQALAHEREKQQLLSDQNKMLEQQVAVRTAELVTQKDELEQTLKNLRATQDQLVQKEKMASLGELTAGIAHEIQNPLNIVNNFADISVRLADELQQEMVAGNTEEVNTLTGYIKDNLQRVSQQGQRASAVVKSMVRLARTSSGEIEPTDLNALTDEYLRIAYQNLKAKNDSLTVDLRLHLDPSLGKVALMSQEMGQVLLNLYDNAFYAITEKGQRHPGGFQPQIEVTTRATEGRRVEIRVRDNGTGIPEEILPKIYQPFFTTKPTGQGNTGLGLALSFEIVTKGHKGELSVETELGEFTEFIISLPE